MSRRFPSLVVLLVALCGSPLAGQSPDWLKRILVAADLPVTTAEARIEGTSSGEIRAVLQIMIGAKVRADEARVLIDAEREARREHGPVDNFGAFVQSQLRAGVRGRDLAAAIKAEHAARGKGRAGGGGGVDRGRGNGRAGLAADRGRGHAGGGDHAGGSGASGASGRAHEAHPGGGASPAGRASANGGGKPHGKGKPAGHPGKPNN